MANGEPAVWRRPALARMPEAADTRMWILAIARFWFADGKEPKTGVTILPGPVIEPLQAHLIRVKKLHDQDLIDGCGDVELPDAPCAHNTRERPTNGAGNLYSRHTSAQSIPRLSDPPPSPFYENYLIRESRKPREPPVSPSM